MTSELTPYWDDQLTDELSAIDELPLKCTHPELELVWLNCEGASRQLRSQCLICFELLPGAKPHSMASKNVKIANLESRDLRRAREREARNAAVTRAKERQELRWQAGKPWRQEWYANYLLSDHWRVLRVKILQRANGKCEGCLEAIPDEVHHLSYTHCPYNEFAFELVALCANCHTKLHEENGG